MPRRRLEHPFDAGGLQEPSGHGPLAVTVAAGGGPAVEHPLAEVPDLRREHPPDRNGARCHRFVRRREPDTVPIERGTDYRAKLVQAGRTEIPCRLILLLRSDDGRIGSILRVACSWNTPSVSNYTRLAYQPVLPYGLIIRMNLY